MISMDKNIKLKRLAEQTGFEISLRFIGMLGASFVPNGEQASYQI